MGNKFSQQHLAFFMIQNTIAASNGQHFKKISALKQNQNEIGFKSTYMNFNQPLVLAPKYPGQPIVPNVIVAADEIFTMNDKQLQQGIRLALPNNISQCTMVDTNPRNKQNSLYTPHQYSNSRLPEDSFDRTN